MKWAAHVIYFGWSLVMSPKGGVMRGGRRPTPDDHGAGMDAAKRPFAVYASLA
jgi:hypothetical protein